MPTYKSACPGFFEMPVVRPEVLEGNGRHPQDSPCRSLVSLSNRTASFCQPNDFHPVAPHHGFLFLAAPTFDPPLTGQRLFPTCKRLAIQ